MSERKERCENCRFWDNDDVAPDDGTVGKCKRYPPCVPSSKVQQKFAIEVAGRDQGIFMGVHPETTRGDWCGEWQPIPPDFAGSVSQPGPGG